MGKMKWYAKTYIGALMGFLYLPIFVLIAYSFNQSKSRALFTGLTLDWYRQLFTNDLILHSLWNTLLIAAVSALIATIIGTAAAIGLNRMRRIINDQLILETNSGVVGTPDFPP